MNQRISLTKKLLKNSLTEMLQTRSIYQVSIRELCERAGINRSTFYKHYGSQFDLLAEMEQDLVVNIEQTLASLDAYDKNALEQIIVYLEQNIDFVRLLINSNVDPEFPEKLFSLDPIRRIMGSLKTDMADDEYDYFCCFLLYGSYEVIHRWINKENREKPARIAALIIRLISP